MFTLPLKFDNQYTGSSNPIYCTGDTSDPMQSFGYKEGAKDCTKGEIIGYYSDLSATKTIQPWILIVRGVGLVLMLSVSVIWLFKFLFWIAHKIALKIQPKK